ncbi:protein-disulfide reductase DsbD domain-containing protein [Endozoicomonas sp. NE40]|uniref:Suppressor for copper-sensitivity B n=1 Tax=Endozoicomonas lisbonensis TaxID=3120522 RepID=A0ABV2SFA4_9GAMM
MLYRNTFLTIFRLLSVCLMLTSANLKANTTDWIFSSEQPSAKIRLLLSGELNKAENQVIAGLQVELDSPWKTYWRSPGEAGIPPAFHWQTNHNVVDTQWLWPVPERFDLLGIQTLGYQDSVVFPLLITVNDPNKPVTLDGILRLSSCTTICVLSDFPVQTSFIPGQLEPDSEAAFLIDKALSKVPETHSMENPAAKSQVIESVNWRTPDSTVVVTASSPDGWQKPDIILDGLQDISFSEPELRIEGTQLQAFMTASSWLGDIDLHQQSVNVTLINGEQATETAIIISNQPVTELPSQQAPFMVMVLFALLGGFILNLMPCVLPVLGLKLSSVVQATGQNRKVVRWQFLSTASGILVSFWLLALFLLALKWTGNNLGWGIQFQNPWFIGFMAVVTGLFAANLLGAFEIQLSSSLNTRLATTGSNNLKGHFVQGMFATLLATPCSAPFLGTAVAFALTTDSIHLFAIFSAMGIGLAVPYILVAIFPAMLSWLPRPGPWMIKLRRIMAVLLIATTLWLVHLLNAHLGSVWQFAVMFFAIITFTYPASGTFFQGKATIKSRHQSACSHADRICLALDRQSDNAFINGTLFSFRKPGLANTG